MAGMALETWLPFFALALGTDLPGPFKTKRTAFCSCTGIRQRQGVQGWACVLVSWTLTKKKTDTMKAVLFYATASLALLFGSLQAVNAQCESDQTIYLTDFTFTPSALTISVGESVAFINAQGTHNVDGTSRPRSSR
jgi:hypothetical protein